MGRFTRWTSGAVVSGLVGWAVGTYTSENRHAKKEFIQSLKMSEDPRVAKYIDSMQSKGFIVDLPQPSFFMALHQQYMFTQAVLTRHKRLHPEGPLRLKNPKTGDLALIFHVGEELVVKDRFAAACTTIFDEGLASAAFPKLPNKIGVTGTLQLSPIYKPAPQDGLLVLYARPTASKGRKSEAVGELVGLTKGECIAKGEVVMIEPWWGKYIAIAM